MIETNIEELVQTGRHFCVLPWIHFHAWPDSRVMPCCVANSTLPVSKINPGETIVQMMNSEAYKKMRLAMLNDQYVLECRRCYELEAAGTWTMRKSHNKRRGLEYVDLIKNTTEPDGSLTDFKMKYMDVRFSNLCNMKCRSCGPGCSSLWSKDYIEFEGMEKYQKYFNTTKFVVSNNEDMSFMSKLKPYLKDVEEVYFAGGEIIITPEHYECMDYWIENDMADTIELSYTTNLSVLKFKDKDLISYWKKFPKLQIWASIDAYGDVAEVMRKGTDWTRIVNNIHRIKKEVPHAQFQITPTISIWNIFSFCQFFDYMIDEGLIDSNTAPRFNTASHPWYANIMILPDFIRNRLIDQYSKSMDKYSYNSEISNGFKVIIQNLKNGNASKFLIKNGDEVRLPGKSSESKEGILEFKQFNDDLDRFRQEKHTDVIPELIEVYQWATQKD